MAYVCARCRKELGPFEIPEYQGTSALDVRCEDCRAATPSGESFQPPPAFRSSEEMALERPPIFLLDPGRSPHLEEIREQNEKILQERFAKIKLSSLLVLSLGICVSALCYAYFVLRTHGFVP